MRLKVNMPDPEHHSDMQTVEVTLRLRSFAVFEEYVARLGEEVDSLRWSSTTERPVVYTSREIEGGLQLDVDVYGPDYPRSGEHDHEARVMALAERERAEREQAERDSDEAEAESRNADLEAAADDAGWDG